MVALLSLLAIAAPADVDLTKTKLKYAAFTDGNGHYLVTDIPDGATSNPSVVTAYYGDGKTFFDTFTQSRTQRHTDPRYYYGMPMLEWSKAPVEIDVLCGKRHTILKRVPAAESDALIAKAVFKRSPLEFTPYTLARDDEGTYYYVEQGRFDDNNSQFRVFSGKRGNMKEQKLTNIVHDSAGDIFATAKGDLRLITGTPTRTEWWKGKAHTPLTPVPADQNVEMIFNDLGVYKNMRLGTPCDDL